jgi:hypothetical protein
MFRRMGWKLLQITIGTGFLFANIYWQWMDNPFVAAVNAGFLAMGVTWLLSKAIDLSRRRRKLRPVEQSRDNRSNPRVRSR